MANAPGALTCRQIFGLKIWVKIQYHGALLVDRSNPTSKKYHQESSRSFDVATEGSADPRAPFIALRDETYRFLELRNKNGIPTGQLGPDISVAVFRNPGERLKHPETLVDNNIYTTAQGQIHGEKIRSDFVTMLDLLYESYAKQGDEVRSDIDNYRREDLDKSHRSTHFVLSVNGEPIGHLQALHAIGTERLNIEEHFRSTNISRSNGFPVEIGRTRILNAAGSRHLMQTYGVDFAKQASSLLLYQKLFTWLNWDLKQPEIVMQVNESMRRVLSHASSPLVFDGAEPVIGPTGIREWILKASRGATLKSEENLMRALLLARARHLRRERPQELNGHYALSFPKSEFPVLRRIGLLSTEKESSAVFKIAADSLAQMERGFYSELNGAALDQMIQILEQRN